MNQTIYQQQSSEPDDLILNDSTWLISDTHFFHANIGQYCNRPDGWQDLIVENWNRLIQPGEIVFHLGDLALGKKEDTEALVPQLIGKIYLMRGNHDHFSKTFYASLGITLVKGPYSMTHSSGQRLIFSHRPISPLEPGGLNLHGHIHNNPSPDVGLRHINLSVEVCEYRPRRLVDTIRPYIGNTME
jgi:calcineurin-like phosphoesterase family protein